MANETDSKKIIESWLEWDLSAAVAADELVPAFEVEALVDRLSELLLAGRHPILVATRGSGRPRPSTSWSGGCTPARGRPCCEASASCSSHSNDAPRVSRTRTRCDPRCRR